MTKYMLSKSKFREVKVKKSSLYTKKNPNKFWASLTNVDLARIMISVESEEISGIEKFIQEEI